MKELTQQPNWPSICPLISSGFLLLTWNPKSINSFTQNGNNAGIITPTINSSRSRPFEENGYQLSKIKRRTSHDILTAHWSKKACSLFHTETRKQPQRLTCHTPCIVKYVLIQCSAFALIKMNSLSDQFETVKMEDVLSFLRYDQLKSFIPI